MVKLFKIFLSFLFVFLLSIPIVSTANADKEDIRGSLEEPDENGYILIELPYENLEILMCSLNMYEGNSVENYKPSKRFRPFFGNYEWMKKLCSMMAEKLENNEKMGNISWSAIKFARLDNGKVQIENSFGTKCFIENSNFQFKIDVNNGKILDGNDQPVICQNGEKYSSDEKKNKFFIEQTAGAFIADYLDLWFMQFASANCIKKGQKFLVQKQEITTTTSSTMKTTTTTPSTTTEEDTTSTSTTEPTTTTTKEIAIYIDNTTCIGMNKYVKVARLTDDHPEWAIRKGYIYSESNDSYIVGPTFMDLYEKIGEDKATASAIPFIQNEGSYSYDKVEDEVVNANGIVKMLFHVCHNVTFAFFVEQAEPDISEVEVENDWSMDFDHLKKCKEDWRYQIRGDMPANRYPLAGPGSKKEREDFFLEANYQTNGLKIGILAKKDAYPTKAQLLSNQYYYGIYDLDMNLPIREHLREEYGNYSRAAKWGLYLSPNPLDDIYKKAEIRKVKINFWSITYSDVVTYGITAQNALSLYVKPDLRQQIYFCDKIGPNDYAYKIYTNRFWPVQHISVVLDGQEGSLIFPEKTRKFFLDKCSYMWPGSVSKKVYLDEKSWICTK